MQKNRQKTNQKKLQKQKKRQNKIKKLTLSKQGKSKTKIEDMVDHALKFVEKGDLKKGERLLTKLKKKYIHHSHIYYGLGTLAAFDGNYEEAIKLYEKTTQLSPDFVEAHYNLGVTYQKMFKIPEMVAAFRQVINYGEPGSDTVQHAQNMLDVLETNLKASDGISLDDYIKGYQIFEQGMKYMESGNWEAAIIEFNNTKKLTPNHPQSYGNLGICYASIGKKQDALDAFDQAIKLDPNYEPAIFNRKMVTSLKDGECFNKKVKTIDYYLDYSLKNKSYIKEFADSKGLLPSEK